MSEGDVERAGGEDERVSKLEREFEKLRSEVEGYSSEMKKTVENLRDAVVDIRSAVSEIENPFNLLRVITSEGDLDSLSKAQSKIQREQPEEERREPERLEEEEKPQEIPLQTLDFKNSVSFIRWIYMMLDLGFNEETIKSVCQYCESFTLIPKGLSQSISNMVEAIVKAKSLGLREEEILLSVYTAADSAGTKIDPSKIIDAVIQVLRRRKLKRGEDI